MGTFVCSKLFFSSKYYGKILINKRTNKLYLVQIIFLIFEEKNKHSIKNSIVIISMYLCKDFSHYHKSSI